ncbi:MAG: PepSY domain-containing protein [Gammaproteobacteria bacterium]
MNRHCDMLNRGLVLGLTFGTTLVISQAAQAEPPVQSPNSAMIGFEQIRQRVETENPGARVTAIELDDDAWRQVYELEITDTAGTAWDLEYDAHTGKLLKRESDD